MAAPARVKNRFVRRSFKYFSETRKKEITAEEKIPFDLNRDEAVISYFENNTKKFMKVILTKKDSNEVPM